MRILGIDYGTKITGLAITDYSRILANPLSNIKTNSLSELINQIKKITERYWEEIDLIVVGYPILLSGSKNQTTLKVEQFLKQLQTIFQDKKIETINEQFTTYVATQNLYDSGLTHQQIKNVKDKVSATVILETYLNQQNKK